MSESEKSTLLFKLLNGDIIAIDIPKEILKIEHLPNRYYFMKETIENESKKIFGTKLRSYRIHLIPNEENEDKYFDYMMLIDERHLDCMSQNHDVMNVCVKNLYHILDLMDELNENEIKKVKYLSFHYDINCGINEKTINDFCRCLSDKIKPTILRWNTIDSESDSRYQYIDDNLLTYFITVKHLIIDSKMTDKIIYYIPKVEELTFSFGDDLLTFFRREYREEWGGYLINTNIHTINIRSPIDPRDEGEYRRFQRKLWPQWVINVEKTQPQLLVLNRHEALILGQINIKD